MIKQNLDNLKSADIYSMILFALYKLIDIPEYSALSELAYVLDRKNLLNLCEYFGGITIKIPTIDELTELTDALLLYQYVKIDKLKELYTKVTGKVSNIHKYYVLRKNEPSNTIPAHLYKDGMRHIHPDSAQARSITVREAARLQTFPDDFEFLGSKESVRKQIGMAVPCKGAQIIFEAILKTFAGIEYESIEPNTQD